MPEIFRGMYVDGDGPKVGEERNCLGARPDEVRVVDGLVQPEKKGMSVRPSVRAFPPRLVPVRLRALHPGAMNQDEGFDIWAMGEGPFEEAPIHAAWPDLILRPDKKGHGTVGPREAAAPATFQAALAGTRPLWSLVQERGKP